MADIATLRPLDVALCYAARGLPVFPCHPGTKAPLTPQGFKSATTARDGVAALWAAHPRAMVGIPTGAGSGVFVLDLDTCPDIGTALGEAWLATVGLSDLLNGPGAQTPSGGRHVYFRADGPAQGLGNTVGRIAPKVDTRGNGGYIIAPGSLRADGRAYLATHGGLGAALPPLPLAIAHALDRKPMAPPPPALPARPVPMGEGATAWGAAVLWGELLGVAHAPAGTRNDRLNRAAFAVARAAVAGRIDAAQAQAQLEAAALSAGLTLSEIRPTIASGWAKGLLHPRHPKDTRS